MGGGGSNAVNRMVGSDINGVEFWIVNTDAQVRRETFPFASLFPFPPPLPPSLSLPRPLSLSLSLSLPILLSLLCLPPSPSPFPPLPPSSSLSLPLPPSPCLAFSLSSCSFLKVGVACASIARETPRGYRSRSRTSPGPSTAWHEPGQGRTGATGRHEADRLLFYVDVQAMATAAVNSTQHIQIGKELTRGLGAGGNPEIGHGVH